MSNTPSFLSFTDRETYLQAVQDWKQTYKELSQNQRARKMEIKRTSRSLNSEVPVFSYDWSPSEQQAWNEKYGRSYGTYTSRHSALQLTINDVALQAQALLRVRSAMSVTAAEQVVAGKVAA